MSYRNRFERNAGSSNSYQALASSSQLSTEGNYNQLYPNYTNSDFRNLGLELEIAVNRVLSARSPGDRSTVKWGHVSQWFTRQDRKILIEFIQKEFRPDGKDINLRSFALHSRNNLKYHIIDSLKKK